MSEETEGLQGETCFLQLLGWALLRCRDFREDVTSVLRAALVSTWALGRQGCQVLWGPVMVCPSGGAEPRCWCLEWDAYLRGELYW